MKERIADAAMKGGILPIEVSPERPGGAGKGLTGAIAGDAQPTTEDVKAVGEMFQEDRSAFIRSMVQRLADKMEENPNDVEGWLRLGRAYGVLGEADKAKDAFGQAKTRLQDLIANTAADAPTRPSLDAALREVEALLAQ